MESYIVLYSGNLFWFNAPEKSLFTVEDIAHALANTCRFGGHCVEFYSVAQHSVEASYIVSPQHAMAALMHDAAEAFVGDMPSPLKMLLPEFKTLEKRIEAEVMRRFNINLPLPAEVKHADLRMLATERRDIMPVTSDLWSILEGVKPIARRIVRMEAKEAEEIFLARYYELYEAEL